MEVGGADVAGWTVVAGGTADEGGAAPGREAA